MVSIPRIPQVYFIAAAAAKSLQSCLTLCDPIDGSSQGSPIAGILQERTLEWVAISFSNAWKWIVKGKSLSRVRLSATPWTIAYQAPPSMGFSRQEYWSGVPLPSPRLCLRGAEKPLKHSEQRISDGTCISERSCSISCENLNQEGSSGNCQGGCLDETK